MSMQDAAGGLRSRLPAWRRAVRVAAPLLFAGALATAAYLTVVGLGHGETATSFSHTYPANPINPERARVTGPLAAPEGANVVRSRHRITTITALARELPRGVLVHRGGHWVLERGVAIASPSVVRIDGPGSILIAPDAFLGAERGGTLVLTHMAVTGVDASGHPLSAASPHRGFLFASAGGKLVLGHDRIANLGHLGMLAYGISLWAPAPGTAVLGSTITGNYFGIYTTHAVGVRIFGNTVAHSLVYGIDPHSYSSGLTIEGNHVLDSGVHGIILADGVRDSVVQGNVVEGSGLHGIVLFDRSDGNTVTGNTVGSVFDGIVVQDSSHNQIASNVVDGAQRFGLRMTGSSEANLVQDNTFEHALLGLYLYAGPTGNTLTGNRFAANRENLRVRSDAPKNAVSPVPVKSEVAP